MPTLEEALAAREKFLVENPHMQPYQDEIDNILDKVPVNQRLEVIHQLAYEKMQKLYEQLALLKEELPDV